MKQITNIKALTGIRFYAALHVVLYHNLYLFGEATQSLPTQLTKFISKGGSAVAFFFILSGFILAHVYKDSLSSKKEKINYFVARVARLYPLYLLAFLMDLPRGLSYFFDTYPATEASLKTLVSSVAHLTMLQSWVPRLTPVWNSPAWSISCEMFFYFVFIFTVHRILERRNKFVEIVVLYLIPIVLYFAVMNTEMPYLSTPNFVTLWRSFPPIRLFEFLIGVYLYGLVLDESAFLTFIKRNSSIIFWLNIVLSILCTQFSDYFSDEIFTSITLVPLYSLLILSAYYGKIRGEFLFNSKVVQSLGISSYAVYIIHEPFKYYLQLFLSPSLLTGCIYILTLLGLCIVLYKYFESPLQKMIKEKLIKTAKLNKD